MNQAVPTWKDISEEIKRILLEKKLLVNFRFPEGSLAQVKHAALKQMDESFRCWKSDLNKRFIQKGLTPFHEFGKITPSQ